MGVSLWKNESYSAWNEWSSEANKKNVVSPTAHVVLILLPPCYTWPRITGWLADNDLHPDSRPDQFSRSLYILVHGDHGQCLFSTWRCPSTWSWQHMCSSSNSNCLQYIYDSLHSMQIADLEPHKVLSVTTWSGFHAQLRKNQTKSPSIADDKVDGVKWLRSTWVDQRWCKCYTPKVYCNTDPEKYPSWMEIHLTTIIVQGLC